MMGSLELINAVKFGEIEGVKKCLKDDVDPNIREDDKYGWTALLYAQEDHHLDIVKVLN